LAEAKEEISIESYQRLTRGRCATRRAGFQICPQPLHRQYVVSDTDLLVVVTAAD